MTPADAQRRYMENLQGEVDSATLYRTLSDIEKNPQLAKVYERLASVEEAHAEFWKKRLETETLDRPAPQLRPHFRARTLSRLARRFGSQVGLPTVNTFEEMDSGQYDRQPEAMTGGLPAAERSHARILKAIVEDGLRTQSRRSDRGDAV